MTFKRIDFSKLPPDTQIRFLDEDSPPFSGIQWIPLYRAAVPELDVDRIFDFHDPDHLGSGPCAVLKPEVKQWCIENLRGNMAHPKVIKAINQEKMITIFTYFVEMANEHDVILFKLRWIG